MKELSIEEKAQAYESIFERLKEMYDNNKTNVAARLKYERYFPELKESKGSEDEKIKDAAIEFVRQNYAWSEDDEKKRNLLIAILNVNHPNGCFKVNPIGTTDMEAMSKDELVSWLKSLKERYTWKPSEEQMIAMQKALVDLCGKDEHNIITGLYYDLKKLRKE